MRARTLAAFILSLIVSVNVLAHDHSRPKGPVEAPPFAPAWLALRIAPDNEMRNELGNALFAHTSPICVDIGGKGVFQSESVSGLIGEIRENM